MLYTSRPDIDLNRKTTALYDALGIAAGICDAYVPFLEAGNVASANVVTELFREAASIEEALIAARDDPAMEGRIRYIESNPSLNLGGEINAVIAAINACRAVGRVILVDENGYARDEIVGEDGKIAVQQIQPSEYATLIQPLKDLRALLADR